MGGQIASMFGLKYVFFSTSVLLLLNAAWVYWGVVRKAQFAAPYKHAS